jgi:2-polyprenyl-3-methyl-5-hydroxy-6-metoxy-1,4-benzoquinol methylase
MMLAHRSNQEEYMDTACSGYEDYRRCLRDLARVNTCTLTHRPMLAWLARHDRTQFSLLDVACGYGDALRRIRRRYPHARLTGIDLNPWATRAAREATNENEQIDFINGDVFALQPDQQFDFIVSSQFTHHLPDDQVVVFLRWLQTQAVTGWFIGDIHRHALPYLGFPILAWIARWHPLVRLDGQISIARAFVRDDWSTLLQEAEVPTERASIAWHMPFRLCVGTR